MLAKALIAGGDSRIIVRIDGEPPMLARVRAVRVVATLADAPSEVIQEQVSNKTELRKLHGRSTRKGLRRQIPEDHEVLRWLVHHAAATVNWFRPGPGFV